MPRNKRTIQLPGMPGPKEAYLMSVSNSHEYWNEYILEDGTTLKLKPVATNIYRLEGEYDANGNPVYIIQSSNIVSVDSPDELKKKSL